MPARADGDTNSTDQPAPVTFSIGELAAHVGTTTDAIRFYEREQVISHAVRTGSGKYRRYSPADAARVAFVKHARDLGFSLDDVRALIALDIAEPCTQCDDAGSIARKHHESVRQRLAQLTSLETRLTQLIDHCHAGRDGRGNGCGILAMIESGA